MRIVTYLVLIVSSIHLSKSAKTVEYFKTFGRLNFSDINQSSVIYQSEVSNRITLVKCAAMCSQEQRCLSYEYCSFPSKENICALRKEIYEYGTGGEHSECQRYILGSAIACQNGGTYFRSFSSCVCPSNVYGDFCENINQDCQLIKNTYGSPTGVYNLTINGISFQTRCDMDTDGGGWTVLQRRFDGSVNFYRSWVDYENGFGSPNGEFWLGNKYIHVLTSSDTYKIRIDMENSNGIWKFAEYNLFRISDAQNKYRLTLGIYSKGTAGDSLSWQNGRHFTTLDADNDLLTSASSYGDANCAIGFTGAWWYNSCHNSNLNGQYGNISFGKGLNWNTFTGYYNSLIKTEMKIRKV